jgi:hypothetical protein
MREAASSKADEPRLSKLDSGDSVFDRRNVHLPSPGRCGRLERVTPPQGTEMDRQIAGVLYAVAMAAVIVAVDLAFFRNRLWERLMVNVGIVLVFAAFYLRVFGRS